METEGTMRSNTTKAAKSGPLFEQEQIQPVGGDGGAVPATTTGSAVAISAEMSGNWGAIEELETTDLLVPKIFHQQAMSKFVSEGKAIPGDFCDSLTGEVLAKKAEKLPVIIFGCFKTMIISKFDVSKNKFEYDKTVTILPTNAREWANKPFMEEINGEKWKYNLTYNYYCLLPDRITEIPFVLSLGSTKTKAAKRLNTMLLKLSTIKKPGAAKVFELTSVVEKNDQGSWFGLEITEGRNSTMEEVLRAHAWYLKSKSEKFVVVDEEGSKAEHDDEVPF